MLWLIAVAAGVFETGLAVLSIKLSTDAGVDGGIIGQVLLRLLIFAGVGVLIAQLRRGKNWSRMTLAVLLGGFGTLSLVIGPLQWLAGGHSPAEVVEAADALSTFFALSRVVHLTAVISALVFMFQPAANVYFRPVHNGRGAIPYRNG